MSQQREQQQPSPKSQNPISFARRSLFQCWHSSELGNILHLLHACCSYLTALKIEDVSHKGEKDNNEQVNSFRYVKAKKKKQSKTWHIWVHNIIWYEAWSIEHGMKGISYNCFTLIVCKTC